MNLFLVWVLQHYIIAIFTCGLKENLAHGVGNPARCRQRTEEWNRQGSDALLLHWTPGGHQSQFDSRIDGRSQMQSAFPCLVHANAHDSWQCSTFEGQICSLRKSFTSIVCKTATDSRFRDVGMCAQDCSHDCGAVNLTCTTTAETWECSTSSSKANMLAKPTALG